MKQSFYYTVLFALGFIALIGIFSEPEPALDMTRWTIVFVVSKSVGFAAAYALYRLLVLWENRERYRY